MHPVILFILIGFLILFPCLWKLSHAWKWKMNMQGWFHFHLFWSSCVFPLSCFQTVRSKSRKVISPWKSVYRQDWDAVITKQEKYQIGNIVAQFYYNLPCPKRPAVWQNVLWARGLWHTSTNYPMELSGRGQQHSQGCLFLLCRRTYKWSPPMGIWVHGCSGIPPENIKLLIKTNLINGHYKIAEKYIKYPERTMRYKGWVKKYEAMLYKPDLVRSDPELEKNWKLLPGKISQ